MLAFASFGNTELEVQKLAAFWTLLAALPMMFFTTSQMALQMYVVSSYT